MYCGKTADWIGMPFGVVSGIGRGMSVLDGSGDRHSDLLEVCTIHNNSLPGECEC